jgi:hypothetical protein
MSFLQQVTQGVAGLQGIEANAQAMQQQQKMQQRETEAEELLMKFQQGGGKDFNLLNQAVLKSPTASKNVLATIGLREESQKKSAAADIASIIPAIGDPAAFNRAMATRIQAIKDRGGDPSDTIRLAKIYQEEGPEAAKLELQMVGAALANEGFLKPEIIGLSYQEPMTAYQAASTDLRKQELQLKALEAQQKSMERALQRETNDLKKQELQLQIDQKKQAIDQAKSEAATKKVERSAELESAKFGVDNMLNSVERILRTPAEVIARATGPIDTMTPTLRQSTADLEELVSTLGSQAFLAQIPNIKGMGALSNAEGDKLQTAFQNFNLRQSPEQLKANLQEAKRLLLKGRSNINKRYNSPDDKPDVPASDGGAKVVDWSNM